MSESLSRVQLSVTLCTAACQASLSMGFSRQEYWSGLPSPSPGDLPKPGIKPQSLELQANSLWSETLGKPQVPDPSLTIEGGSVSQPPNYTRSGFPPSHCRQGS